MAMAHGPWVWIVWIVRLGFHAAALDVNEPQAILTEALRLAKATPQDCGVLSTKHLEGA